MVELIESLINGLVKSQNFLPAGRQAGLNYSILRIHNVFK